jgi:hypothetical protein
MYLYFPDTPRTSRNTDVYVYDNEGRDSSVNTVPRLLVYIYSPILSGRLSGQSTLLHNGNKIILPWEQSGRGVKLTTHLRRTDVKNWRSYTYPPPHIITCKKGSLPLTYLLYGAESFLRSQLVLQLIKKFTAFYGTRKFTTVLTSARIS